jgi:intergrase/recombinase
MWEANTEPRSATNPTESGKMDKDRLDVIARTIAVHCEFENAEKFTGRSLRKLGINKLASFGVPMGEICFTARHNTIHVNNEYQHYHADTAAKQHCSLHQQNKVSMYDVLILIRKKI